MKTALPTQADRIEAFRPKCAAIIRHKQFPIIGLLFRPEPDGRCCWALFSGARPRPDKYYRDFSQDGARRCLEQCWLAAVARYEAKSKQLAERAARRATLRAADHFMVGDVLVNTWGYSMIIVDYYQVTAVLARSIKIREINAKRKDTGFLRGISQPDRYNYVGEEILKP